MCEIYGKLKRKTATGYKIAVEKSGKFYSPFTGIRYDTGRVPVAETARKFAIFLAPKRRLDGWAHYNPKMAGKTGIITRLGDAKPVLQGFKDNYGHILGSRFVLLKMKISGDLHAGNYDFLDIIVGNTIESIEVKR